MLLFVLTLCLLQDLYEEFDALLLCTGATWPRDLPIPGRQLEGIHYAMAFLESWQKKQMGNAVDQPHLLAKEKDVIVIGGGDTGCDCIATSLRQVNMLYTIRIHVNVLMPPQSFLLKVCAIIQRN
jgi:NADPH-dependent glutamate synthase beta subunit-like oxidoreductase